MTAAAIPMKPAEIFAAELSASSPSSESEAEPAFSESASSVEVGSDPVEVLKPRQSIFK